MSSSENKNDQEQLTPAQQRLREKMKIYSILNILFIIYFVAFLLALAFVAEKLLLCAAICADIAAFGLLNGLWLLCTRYPSYLLRVEQREKRVKPGVICLVAGHFALSGAILLFMQL